MKTSLSKIFPLIFPALLLLGASSGPGEPPAGQAMMWKQPATSAQNLDLFWGSGSEAGKPAGAVVLCHGFGAPGDDLVPLYGELVHMRPDLAKQRFIFPEAPLSLGPGSRAWWMIDFEERERAMRGGAEALRALQREEPKGMPQARAMLRKPRLLVLDEAANAIDAAGEAALLDRVKALDPRPTILMISHREESLSWCDRVIRVSDGSVTG